MYLVKLLSGPPFPGPLLGLMMATVGTVFPLAAIVSQAAPGYWYKGTMTFIVEEHPPLEPLVGATVAVEGLVVGPAVAGLVVGLGVAAFLVGATVDALVGLAVAAALVGLAVAAALVGAAVAAGLVVAALVGLVVAEGLVVAASFVGAAVAAALVGAVVGFTGAVVGLTEPELYDTPVLTTPAEREEIALSIVTCLPFTAVRRTDTGKLILALALSV